jgi:hypothetical protein
MGRESDRVDLARLKPSPSPAIRALPEYRAEGDLKADYDDTRAALQVPWMGVVAMAFAHYRRFYGVLWPALKPLMVSRPLIAACEELRVCAERAARALSPPPLEGRLTKLGYAPGLIVNVAFFREQLGKNAAS